MFTFKELKELVGMMPVWFRVLMVAVIVLGSASMVYAFSHCGWQVFLFRDPFLAVQLGLCK
jgi:hypothetical protein